jgi:curved DNA-binding protein CbpA
MTDFFALLGEPRQPWLDLEALKQKYHQLTRTAHPDLWPGEPNAEFERINQAYRVLLDPKQRIHHLLALEASTAPAADHIVPVDLEELFLKTGKLAQDSKRVLEQLGSATGALSKSLLQGELLDLRSRTQEISNQLSRSYENCLAELRQLNALWKENRARAVTRLQLLYDQIAYLTRWITQVEEIQFQLSLQQ